MTFDPSPNQVPFTSVEVKTKWNYLKFNPKSNPDKKGGVYISYTTGLKNGPGGYFGVQLTASGGKFLFSIWDEGRFIGSGHDKKAKPADALAWPMDMVNCSRHCLDCALEELRPFREKGLTTGTQCFVKYDQMQVGDRFKIRLTQDEAQASIKTANYGGMAEVHTNMLGEPDREVVGGKWSVRAYDMKRKVTIFVGTMLLEGDGSGMHKLGTFDEMLGCTKCNAVQHKDTRYGPVLDGSRRPTKMEGLTKAGKSRCKQYQITGSQADESITFEGGPFTKGSFPYDGNEYQPVWG